MVRLGRSRASRRLSAQPFAGLVLCRAHNWRGPRRSEVAEERVFRWFNDAPNRLHGPAWVIMQSGSLAGVFLAAGALAGRRRPRTATAAALVRHCCVGVPSSSSSRYVGRGRPAGSSRSCGRARTATDGTGISIRTRCGGADPGADRAPRASVFSRRRSPPRRHRCNADVRRRPPAARRGRRLGDRRSRWAATQVSPRGLSVIADQPR